MWIGVGWLLVVGGWPLASFTWVDRGAPQPLADLKALDALKGAL